MCGDVYVRLMGGLGNQLFQYAAGLSLANKLNADLKLDLSWYDSQDERKFFLDKYKTVINVSSPSELSWFAEKKLNIFHRILFGTDKKKVCLRRDATIFKQHGFHYDESILDVVQPVLLKGYFQSSKYFEDISDRIQSEYILKEPISEETQQVYNSIKSSINSVSLHIRRGDYLASNVHQVCSQRYYQNAMEIMQKCHNENVKYFIFSDDIDYVSSFVNRENACIVSCNDKRPWEDLFLMSACDSHIIANSSFSWWGAWLNSRKSKIVIAPRYWFKRESMFVNNTIDLYEDGWIII